MANRYWVGGTASWDATAGTKWALTSGAAGGQTVPTNADDVFFDAASGAVTVTVNASRVSKSVTCTGFTGTITGSSTPQITISGSLVIASGMTIGANFPVLVFDTAASNITSAGLTLKSITVSGASASLTLLDALTLGATDILTLTQGTFDGGGFAVTCGSFNGTNSNTRTLTLGNGTWTITATTGTIFTLATTTGLTFNKGTSNIVFTATSTGSRIFSGGNLTYNNFTVSADSSGRGVTISGTNTFATVTYVAPNCFIPNANLTIATLAISGSSSLTNMVSIISATPATPVVLTITNNSSHAWAAYRGITFTGAGVITTTNSIDLGINSGITINAPATGGGGGSGNPASRIKIGL